MVANINPKAVNISQRSTPHTIKLNDMDNKIPQEWNDILLKDVTFIDLMKHRIYNVLIVANPYDAFMLEDDGRIDE